MRHLFRNAALQNFSEINNVLNELADLLPEETINKLNCEVEIDRGDIAGVAQSFVEGQRLNSLGMAPVRQVVNSPSSYWPSNTYF